MKTEELTAALDAHHAAAINAATETLLMGMGNVTLTREAAESLVHDAFIEGARAENLKPLSH